MGLKKLNLYSHLTPKNNQTYSLIIGEMASSVFGAKNQIQIYLALRLNVQNFSNNVTNARVIKKINLTMSYAQSQNMVLLLLTRLLKKLLETNGISKMLVFQTTMLWIAVLSS